MFKIENKWILKLQILLSRKTGWFKNKLYHVVTFRIILFRVILLMVLEYFQNSAQLLANELKRYITT